MKPRGLERLIGLVIAVAVGAAAVALWLVMSNDAHQVTQRPERGVLFGLWDIVYDTAAPSPRIIVIAIALAVFAAAAVALIERKISNHDRRTDAVDTPLNPKRVMAETRGVYAGPVRMTALIPAHNEAASIRHTIESLLAQSYRPDRVIVVADNCTDDTVGIALDCGVEVIETVGNAHKKAGALNQVLRDLLPSLGDNDVVAVMDADTALDDGFLQTAVHRFTDDRALMAVGGLFYGEEGHGLLGQFQRNEYIRYAREMRRRRGRVYVLTGTASIFRARALRTIAASRGTTIPGRPGDVYDTAALTEDNEITIAIKALGGLMVSPAACTVVTELMPTWSALWAQRLRWQRGALENLGAYGVRRQTFRYWVQQLGIGYGVIALSTYLLLIALMAVSLDAWVWFPFWIGLGAIFMVERLITVWKGGWRARLVAATLFPELLYAMFLNVVFVKGILDISLGRDAAWKHVARPPREPAMVSREAS